MHGIGRRAPRAGALPMVALVAAVLAALLSVVVAAGSVHAQEPTSTTTTVEPGQITVTGSATRSVSNDAAQINLSVSATRDRAIDAVNDVNTAMDAVLSALMAEGISSSDLRTVGLSLQPQYDFSERERVLIGFQFSNSLLVTVDDIDQVGRLLDVSISAGGDLLQINGVSFIVSNLSAIEDIVRLSAIDNAVSKARAIADRLDLRLGRAISVRDFSFTPVRSEGVSFDQAPVAAPTPVFAGESEVTVSVEIVFETWPGS